MISSPEMLRLLEDVREWVQSEPRAQEYRALKLRLLIKDGYVDLAAAIEEWKQHATADAGQ